MSPFRLSARALPARAQSPVRSLDPAPVAVPWRVVRRSLGIIEIEHRGVESAHQVRFALAGAGMLGLSLPSTLHPGERIRVAVRGSLADEAAEAHDAMLVMRWFQPDGTELLWPIPLE
ncbi:hypothetical protein [Leucobacter denitrificans]|uniref:Uncharacterized protein n=1 Tax=Leucobacter denitrificans TaxID=683042 RepID=A0A7G9S2F6_9MICO|nr:hypothetical protein [Leucobacter denitrificans]QNN62031.1 hypothetical protein H9L06_06825 [Leucobacter denitrificans]